MLHKVFVIIFVSILYQVSLDLMVLSTPSIYDGLAMMQSTIANLAFGPKLAFAFAFVMLQWVSQHVSCTIYNFCYLSTTNCHLQSTKMLQIGALTRRRHLMLIYLFIQTNLIARSLWVHPLNEDRFCLKASFTPCILIFICTRVNSLHSIR